jgi:hypothetical protein
MGTPGGMWEGQATNAVSCTKLAIRGDEMEMRQSAVQRADLFGSSIIRAVQETLTGLPRLPVRLMLVTESPVVLWILAHRSATIGAGAFPGAHRRLARSENR